MDRRQFLKRGIVGGVLLAGTGLLVWPPRREHAPDKSEYLSGRAIAVLGAVAARVVDGSQVDPRVVAERVDASLRHVLPEVRRDLERLLLLFDNALAGLFLDGRLRPFSALSPEAQDAVLASWRDSSLVLRRSGYHVLRRLCLNACYADRSTHLALGYPGPRPTGGIHYDDSKVGT